MKKIQCSVLTTALAVFTFAISSPTAFAIPKGKVPGAYFDGRFGEKATGSSVCCENSKNGSGSKCESRAKKVKKASVNNRAQKPYWKKKIGD